jgi:beta-lactamase regulating signal transducer with metallopeptidase domain
VDTLLTVGLGNALAAGVLALVAAAGTRLGRPALAHALWLAVLVKLVTPPLWFVPLPWPDERPTPAAAEDLPPPGPPATRESRVDAETALPVSLPNEPGPAGAPVPWPVLAAGCWLGGSVAWWAVAGWRLRRFHRLLREARPAPAEVVARAQRLAGLLGLGGCPGVWLIPAPVSPLLLALGRSPRVLLPAGLWPLLSAEQQETLLAHELAHLRRRDHWVRRLELLALGLYWWYPLAWWVRRRLQEAEEECCDAWVVAVLPDSGPAYAAALVETVLFVSGGPLALPAAASGAGHVPLLKRRLTMILRPTPPRRLSGAGLVALLAGALLLPLLSTRAGQPAPAPGPAAAPAPAAEPANRPPAVRAGKTCTDCHALMRDDKDLYKHAHWERLHEEAVRLNDELLARRAALREAEAARPGAPPGRDARTVPLELDKSERVQELQDEIELLRAQLKVKEAQVEAAQQAARAAADRLDRAKRLGVAISAGDLAQAVQEAAATEAQVRVRKAELDVDKVKLRQAERRLARLQGPAAPAPEDRRRQEDRLLQLEKHLKDLTDEIKRVQQELRKEGQKE